jgi:ribose/xylose/arabinose/galactoside ABC-type transport system permease subunit
LPRRAALAKAHGISAPGGPMSGIYMILVFVAVLAALNRFEFGRFD